MFEIRQLALEEIEINKKIITLKRRFRAKQKFIKNKFLKSISFKKIDEVIENHKVKNISKKLYKEIKKSKLYNSYMLDQSNELETEKKFF